MLQIKKGKATRRYERIAAAIGAVLVIVVGFNTMRAESAQTGREQLGNTIDYVKEQCTTYTRSQCCSCYQKPDAYHGQRTAGKPQYRL